VSTGLVRISSRGLDTQRDIARTVRSVREVVGRTMQEFERLGAVRRRTDGNLELNLHTLERIQDARRPG
jgi:hypothetical protein